MTHDGNLRSDLEGNLKSDLNVNLKSDLDDFTWKSKL